MATHEVAVEVPRSTDPLVSRTFAILKDRVERRSSARLLESSLTPQIVLAIVDDLPDEAFRIDKPGPAVRITGGSPRGLLYGVGKFLRLGQMRVPRLPWRSRGSGTASARSSGCGDAKRTFPPFVVVARPTLFAALKSLRI